MSDGRAGQHTADAVTPEQWVEQLVQLGEQVRRAIRGARQRGEALAEAVAHEGGDTIFAVDRHVEPVIDAAIEAWPDRCKPMMLVAEGLGESGRKRFDASASAPAGALRYHLIIDPIDGTRNIMYDKRSAWFIAAVVESNGGEAPRLTDAVASVIVELPPSKAGYADTFTAVRGQGATARRTALFDGLPPAAAPAMRPSTAVDLRNGFAQVANFFPGTKVLASQLMERLVSATLGDVAPGSASVFDDQYITTAGQFVELMLGHDRFCADLRPLFYDVLERDTGQPVRGLECHPYDIAGLLVAREAGLIITDGFGRPLDAPLDVHQGVHWCGYANQRLHDTIQPIITQWFQERGIQP